ncbi:MAG: tRNA dihydrouridine synthase DusB [Beijerinckiaceae bacterium]|jgi:tRNA-dihydrouridine synthase B|nr:tRNA dihydrouridine synthase DusB [Beijerinckiaceae bacterium]
MDKNAQILSKDRPSFAIGSIAARGRAILAPLSGVTDIGMRRIAESTGATLVVSEMVASDEYVNGKNEARLRAEGEGLATHAVQIAGCDGRWMAEAARLVEAAGADIIDINMGCPSKRVNGRFSGSALMRDLDHASELISATVSAVQCPVTLKMRLGWDDSSHNAPELARRAQDLGVQMITVHGRTRQQFYKGKANWSAIAPVRDAITIPLVANGDCHTLEDARDMLNLTGADAVMIGRAAVGQPWLVGAIADGLAGRPVRLLSQQDKASFARQHLDTLVDALGPAAGLRHARKHLAAYADQVKPGMAAGGPGWARARVELVTSESLQRVYNLLQGLMTGEFDEDIQTEAGEAA